jgi:hypothetical protein
VLLLRLNHFETLMNDHFMHKEAKQHHKSIIPKPTASIHQISLYVPMPIRQMPGEAKITRNQSFFSKNPAPSGDGRDGDTKGNHA